MRIIVLVGKDFLFDSDFKLQIEKQNILIEKLADLKEVYNEVILITAGSIPMGKTISMQSNPSNPLNNKIYASIGYPYLSLSYTTEFKKRDIHLASLLLSVDDIFNKKSNIDMFVSNILQNSKQIPFISRNYILEDPKQILNFNGNEYVYRSCSLSMFLYKILNSAVMFYVVNDHKVLFNQDDSIRSINYTAESMNKEDFNNESMFDLWNNIDILGSHTTQKKPIVVTEIDQNTSFIEMVKNIEDEKYIKDPKITTIYI